MKSIISVAARIVVAASTVVAWNGASTRAAETPFYLRDGERVVFYGDSITQGGAYVRYVEAYLLTRFPEKKFEVVNHGISSETISGTSETDHNPRRPWALERFDRDIKAWQPDVVVACFGMNDGNYHPFDEERFRKYQDGIRTLIRRVRDECGARLTIMTPPTYDPYQRKNGDPAAKEYGYKYAYVGYDETLAKYAAWLTTLREPNVLVVDLHTAMAEHLAQRRRSLVSFTMQPDAVHPNATGHFVMAKTLLKAWGADVAPKQDRAESVAPDVFRLTMNTPWPIDPACDAESLKLLLADGAPGTLEYAVAGLRPGKYSLSARLVGPNAAPAVGLDQERPLGEFTSAELERGIDLARLADYPGSKIAVEALNRVTKLQQATYGVWRKAIKEGADGLASASPKEDAYREAIRALAQPHVVELKLTPVER